MEYEAQLHFLRRLLDGMHIHSCIITNPEESIPSEIDLHLRKQLFRLNNYVTFLQNPMASAKNNTIYRFFDEYDCNYIFLRLPTGNQYFFMGPYLLSFPSESKINRKARDLQLSPAQTQFMHLYYTELPIVEDENLLLTMANTLALHLWESSEHFSLEYVDYAIPDRYEPIPLTSINHEEQENTLSLTALEHNYARENQLMDAVSKGKLHLLTAVASSVFNNGAKQRLNDSLRDCKNYLIILKTLLRKAAEYGGVHPLHIDKLSSRFAGQIENVHTIKQVQNLQEEMIRGFCQLVKQHSLNKYSYYVGQTITLVQYDLTADLRLKTIAEKLNVNSSYLSDLFHREYGCTLTDFITKQRIDHSIYLLQFTTKPLQNIASECGIHDVNYFIKLFKKQTGFTPNRYRKEMGNAAI